MAALANADRDLAIRGTSGLVDAIDEHASTNAGTNVGTQQPTRVSAQNSWGLVALVIHREVNVRHNPGSARTGGSCGRFRRRP